MEWFVAMSPNPARFGPRDVAFGNAMAQIPGHYRVALELYLAGDLSGAIVHAGHPLMEVLPVVYEDLIESGLAAPVSRALGIAAQAVRERRSAKDVGAAFEAATKAGGGAIAAVVGGAVEEPAYRASVAAALLRAAVEKHRLAVAGGRVNLLPEYQDAYGFVLQADRMLEELAGSLEPVAEEKASRSIAALKELIPGPSVTDAAPTEDVELHAEACGDVLAAAGALLRERPTPEETLARVEYRFALLKDVIDHEEKGRAQKICARIYAEDLTPIADELTALDPAIAERIATLVGRELRLALNSGASWNEIAGAVQETTTLLRSAVERLSSVK